MPPKEEQIVEKIDLNTASREELMLIPSVGSHAADSIVRYRKVNGKFARLDELKRVKGITDAMLARIGHYAKV